MKYIFTTILIIFTIDSFSQSVIHSQNNFTPLEVNPALPASDNDLSVTFDNRTQNYYGGYSLKTNLVTLELPFVTAIGKRWGGIGFSAISDKADFNNLQQTGFSGAFSYNLRLGRVSYLSAGIHSDFVQRKISASGIETGSQWRDGYGFDGNLSHGENIGAEPGSYFSVGSGVLWYRENREEYKKMWVGLSVYNLNRPNDAILGSTARLSHRYVANIGYRVIESRNLDVIPELLYVGNSKLDYFKAGSTFSFKISDDNPYDIVKPGSIDLGIHYAYNNSGIFSIQVNQPSFSAGFSYDLALSGKDGYNNFSNAPEIAVSFKKTLFRKKRQVIEDRSLGEVRTFENTPQISKKEEKAIGGPQKTDTVFTVPKGNFEFELKKDFKFRFNDTTLNEGAKAYLDDLAELLKLNPDLHLEVIGHSDIVGNEEANRKISELRAIAVVNYLQSKGIEPNRLKSQGKGAKEPLVPNDSEENRSRNRRVEFIIYR